MSAISEKTISYAEAVQNYGAILSYNNCALSVTVKGPQDRMTKENIKKVLLAVGKVNFANEKSAAAANKYHEESGVYTSLDNDLTSQMSRTNKEAEDAFRALEDTYRQTGLRCSY